LAAWQAYNWPGNLRELEDSVKRYLMVRRRRTSVREKLIKVEGAVRNAVQTSPNGSNHSPALRNQSGIDVPDSRTLRSLIQRVKSDAERNAIAAALQRLDGIEKAAARLLKVSLPDLAVQDVQYQMTPSNSALYSGAMGGGAKMRQSVKPDRKESPNSENQLPRSPHQELL